MLSVLDLINNIVANIELGIILVSPKQGLGTKLLVIKYPIECKELPNFSLSLKFGIIYMISLALNILVVFTNKKPNN